MKTLYHIFTANRHHLTPGIVKNIINNISGFSHKFILIGNNPKNPKVYQELISSKLIDYSLVQNIRDLKTMNGTLRRQEVYLHGVPYTWMVYFIMNRYNNINWICWGTGASTDYKSFKSILIHPLKKMLYHRFKKIGVLMPQDEKTLAKTFNLKNIYQVAYSSGNKTYSINVDKILEEKCNNNTVFIGNNSSCINTYLEVAKQLSDFVNIKVVCMLNYSFKESPVSKALMEYGKSNFGERFRFDTQLYNFNDYVDYMDSCDIYICAVEQQTGLGAIYTSLKLGKKLYLNGKNYEWITSLGCKVFHVNELLTISEEEFITPITLENKIKNYNIIINHFSLKNVQSQWKSFFNGK